MPVGAKARSAVAVLRAVYPGVWVYLGSRYTGPARLVMFSRALCVQAQGLAGNNTLLLLPLR